MKRMLIILILFVPLSTQAASLITNGSFEADGAPIGWDINIPTNFHSYINTDWSTHGTNSLQIYSNFYSTFSVGDTAYISQQVDLTDANELSFDIYLYGYEFDFEPWDSNKVTAFVRIDDELVDIWATVNADGVYDVNVPIDSYTGIHTLHFGMRMNVSDYFLKSYYVHWDFIKLDTYCGGFGYLDADLNQDCYVDFADLDIMAGNWLRSDLMAADDYLDLARNGSIDLFDFAAFAEEWMQCTYWGDDNCFEVPLDLAADINMDGIVNFADYAILSLDWDITGDNLAGDIDGSGKVDYNDIKMMNTQWLQKSWLYEN